MAVFQDITSRTLVGRWDPKDPDDIVDYWFDATPAILPKTAMVASVAVTLPDVLDQPVPEPTFSVLTKVEDEVDGNITRVRFAGGVPVNDYDIEYDVTLDDGQVHQFTCVLPVKQRRSIP